MNFSGGNKTKGPGGPVMEVFIKIFFEPFNERMTTNEDLGNAALIEKQYLSKANFILNYMARIF